MAKLKRYPSLTKQGSVNPYKTASIILAALFVIGFFYGAIQIINELRSISEGQQILILKLAGGETQATETENSSQDISSTDVVSKVEFIKFRNESRKKIRDLTKDLRLVQAKLRMKQTVLDKY